MKKIFTLLFMSVFALTSCSNDGPQGPPGPPGPQGPPGPGGGDAEIGTVIDLVGTFNAANDYSLLLDFNEENIEVFESDAVLVYMKTGEDGTADGAPVEVFRMLPQTYYINGEALQYNFDFTFFDVLIFLDGTVDLASLDTDYTNDRVFRVVIVPAEFAETMDTLNIDAVLKSLDIQEMDIKKANF
ncbi:collagen-like protein [Antarcticibacterium flavum]|uniref:Collagen-like protein n=1 Tax=Antarcticibacterium flavum TaxID=2058175 RepID=A0A5B7X0U1_9FLAO|nr:MULTISPECIES: collagen-like protein [Antarcticibacterium]MCM4161196.1 hypothetical protein [Antarcticibacterium sp. W02-3]QCY68302.1 collagen-like protein [Antarcticibacterium flavum]